MAVFDALGSLEEDWKDNLPDQDEIIEHELVFSKEDIEEFNKEPEGSDSPPNVYQDDEAFPLEEIIEQSEAAPSEAETQLNDDNIFNDDDDEPSALAELQSRLQSDTPASPELDNHLSIAAQAENLITEIENNFRKDDDQPQDESQDAIAEDIFYQETLLDDDNDKNNDNTYEFVASEIYTEVEEEVEEVNPTVSMFEDAPSVLRDELEIVAAGKAGNKTAIWVSGLFIMSLLLAFQIIYANKEEIATHESFRGPMISMCEIMSCKIPLRNDAAQGIKSMVIQNHAISKIPEHPDQLRIKAIFSNNARYIQAYPILSIKLSGHDERITAMRRFRPEEYLAKHINIDAGLPAKTAVEIIIDIMEPSTPVISYQLDFN